MTIHAWFMYLILVLVAASTPGPAVLFIMTNSTLHGWKKAIFAALGNISGLLIMGIIAVTGLGALLNTSELVFNLVKYAGAAYLAYLGIKMFCQRGIDFNQVQSCLQPEVKSAKKMFVQALGVALSNPKAIVFLTALLPQFMHVELPILPQFSILIATLMFFSFAFLMFYALLAHKAKFWLMKPRRMKIFGRVSGSIFVGFGALLATSSHR
ncbi:Threonine/homoserine/homoserine lactone efflux protein [Desulfuromusa kysingii]|uniref:Threonine/homoserine/homoserine lactone efflux protein n=1 Tax=Desulfuromusa kysingii TaxID=37625 RepID=A0A1H3XDT2_9BACT|nr:LysE family translocator [Desulfuromusa kysingii]SDZ97565.1 Threonine/homoserine/homoserine lactone efflux protein [Desulfuromusa kysingii]